MALSISEKAKRFARALVTRRLDIEYSGMPCRLGRVSAAKLLNLMLSQVNCSRKNPRRPWYPIQLHVETSATCNLRCPLCPSGMGLIDGPRKLMPFSTFQALMDETGDHVISTLLWGWGEPLLNPKLTEMVRYARTKNVATILSTNGQYLESREEAEAIVASGLNCLIISLDGATQESYARYRVGGEISRTLRCLELVRQARDSLNSATPVLNVQTVVLKHNEHELGAIENLARKHGADMVTRMSSHMPNYAGKDADERFAPEDPRYRRFEYRDGKRVYRSIRDYTCIRPWDRMTVTWDGSVVACEHDFNTTTPFGKAGNGSSFMDAWWGDRARAFRAEFLRDKSAYPFCADCHYRDNVSDCLVDTVHFTDPWGRKM